MKRSDAFLIFAIIFISSCTKNGHAPQMPGWLIGTWQTTHGKDTIYESWIMVDDTTWSGMGWFVSDEDTSIIERLKLSIRGDTLYYVADVPQNKSPVEFKATIISYDKYVFENPEHDFPQRIIYSAPQNDTLRVRIESAMRALDIMYIRNRQL